MINEGEVKARNKALKKSWEAGEGSKAYINKKTDPNTGKPIDSSEKGEYHKAIMKHGTIPAWKRIGRTMRGNKKMDEQFIDRVINILIEQHKLRPDNFGGRGQSGGQLKDPASRARAAKTLRLKRGLDKVGAPKAPTMKEESTVLDRVIKILAEGKRSKALARATNPNKINKLKASQERGDSKRALKAGKGGEDALNRMFGIGKKGS